MNKIIYIKLAAIVALLFSLFTLVEGTLVLLGTIQHEYLVFIPLMVYNIAMATIGLIVSVIVWFNHSKALMLSSGTTASHLMVLIIVSSIYLLINAVSLHSVQAMAIRTIIWLAITIVIWKVNQPNKKENFIL